MKKPESYTWSFFTAIFIAVVFIVIWLATIEHPFIPVNLRVKRIVHSVLPQGWAFFTKDPKTTMYDIYKREDGHLTKINFKTSEPENLFGISRKSIKIKTEVSDIAAKLPDSLWNITTNQNDFDRKSRLFHLMIVGSSSISSGKYLIVSYEPIPFDSLQNENYHQQYKFIQVNLMKPFCCLK